MEPFDLFGEIPVTWPEILAWCEHVARIPADSPRLAHYVRGWNVPQKIRAAKLAGTLDAILEIPKLAGTFQAFIEVATAAPGFPHPPELVRPPD